jgi:predicted nucleotidyltransferase
MLADIATRRDRIADLCRRHHVRRLELFGSAARGDGFDPTRSDVDFLVAFDPDRTPTLEDFFGLRQALSDLLGRPVDLVAPSALRNPYLRASVAENRELVYAA